MSSRYRELSASSLLRPSPFFLVDFIVFTFQGTSFSPRRRPVRSFFLFQYGDLLLTFLFSRNNALPSPRRASMHHRSFSLSLSRFLESNNRLRHSFFSSSSMNLCLQQLCKKKGGTGKKKRKEKNIESFRGRNLAYRNPMHLIRSLFLFSSSSTRKNLASKRFNRWIFRVASTGVARRSDSLSLLPAKFVK